MPNYPIYDVKSGEAISSPLVGINEAISKIANILNIQSTLYENVILENIIISSTDKNRLYQAPLNQKFWDIEFTPVIRINGTIVNPATNNFSIDYTGGLVQFINNTRLLDSDVVTANFKSINLSSQMITDILNKINQLELKAEKNKGYFATETDLITAFPNAIVGDWAIVGETDTVWVWDSEKIAWKNTAQKIDLSNYYTKPEVNQKVDEVNTVATSANTLANTVGNNFNAHAGNLSIHTPALTAHKTIYVSPTGSDESGDGSEGKPYRSINFAHKHLPLNHGQYQVYIKCKNGMYDENIFISNHYNGLISISACESNPDVTVNSIWYEKCSDIAISDIKVKGFITSGWSQIYIGDCNKANIIRVKAETTDKTKTGIWTRNTLSTTIQLTTVSNKEVAFRCSQGNMCLSGIQGENNNIGYLTHGISDGLGGTISLGYGCSLTATVLIQEQYGGRVFGGSHKKNFKLKFNIDGIATTGECYYVEFDDLVYINAKVVVTSRDTSQADNTPVYLLGLPVVAPPDYQSNNSISSINGEFVGYRTHIGFVSLSNTAINIALSNVTGASTWATLGHIKVGTSIHINGFYLIKK